MVSILSAAAAAACGLLLLRTILSFKSIVFLLGRLWRAIDDKAQAYQIYTIPQHADNDQLNPLYRKAAAYVASLPSVEDSDLGGIFSTGRKPNDFYIQPGPGQPVADSFLGARLRWSHHPGCLHLRVRRQDRHRVLRPYLQHVESVADDIELRRKEVKLFANYSDNSWRSVPFTHPSTLDTVAMEPELKSRVKSDLESFLKARNYYLRLGRVWKRSYLLYGPPGTGKSTFVAAMAKFLCYDIYDLDLSKISEGADLKSLLLHTSPKSVILVEDLDRYLTAGSKEEVIAMHNFMDGVFSCCGEERVMVFTMCGASKDAMDPAVLRPGRLDVHIYFPLCDFSAFKTMASSYLGLKRSYRSSDSEMDPVFSVEEISDPFWADSPATSAVAAGGRNGMHRSPSEWFFERFLEEEAAAAESPNPNPNPNPTNPCASSAVSSNLSSGNREGGDDEVLEIRKHQIPAVGAMPPSSSADLTADADPSKYAAILKQKLDLYCHAVAIARDSGVKPQDSSLADSRSPATDCSQLGPLAPVSDGGPSGIPALSAVQNLGGRPATSGSSREQSDDDDLEGETEMTDNMDPADAKRVRRLRWQRME